MPATLIFGPNQSGKSFALWQWLRAEAPGQAWLVRPQPGLPRELVRQAYSWGGAGLLPPVVGWGELLERLAVASGEHRRVLSTAQAAHLLRPWLATRLRGTRREPLAGFRATAREVAELVLRLDDHRIADQDLALAGRPPAPAWLTGSCAFLAEARAWLAEAAGRQGLVTAGARAAAIIAAGPALPVAALYLDDFLALTPAELAVVARVAQDRRVVIAAVADARLGRGALAERLLAAMPDATVEGLAGIHPQAQIQAAQRQVLTAVLDESHDPGAGLGTYHYLDHHHAGRALAAWLRQHQVPPGDLTVYVRVADGAALAVADALIAAGVPAWGDFQVPLTGTAVGGLVVALAAWSRLDTWERFLHVAGRLPLATGDAPPPVAVAELLGPWGGLTPVEALERLAASGAREGQDGMAWGGREADLAPTVVWLRQRWQRLHVAGTWRERFSHLLAELDLGAGSVGVLGDLERLATLGPVDPADLDDLLTAARVTVSRRCAAGEGAGVHIADAVRGRTWPRPVVALHGLEHGVWPRQPVPGSFLTGDERAALAGALGKDLDDGAGRMAGEIGTVLAVIARATATVLLGIPGGERAPAGWLGLLAAQMGLNLEHERERLAFEAVPGAPLGPDDSQGEHEVVLWSSPDAPALRSGRFQFPALSPDQLGLKPSALNGLRQNSFAWWCERLDLGDSLDDLTRREDGIQVHALLAHLHQHPPQDWSAVIARELPAWVAQGRDHLERAQRQRLTPRLLATVATEAEQASAAGVTTCSAERRVQVALRLLDDSCVALSGVVDRLDDSPAGLRLVDYKNSGISRFQTLIKEQDEGQLLAYRRGLAEETGRGILAAAYLALRTNSRTGYGAVTTASGKKTIGLDGAATDAAEEALRHAIAALIAGDVAGDPRDERWSTLLRAEELVVADAEPDDDAGDEP